MTSTSACDRCAKTVKPDEDHIECMGFCDQVYHVRCINLNLPFVRILREKINLFWMCDECSKLMKYARFRNTVSSLGNVISTVIGSQLTGLSELKTEMAKNNNQVAQLTHIVNAATPGTSARPNHDRLSKRRRGDTETPTKPTTGTRVIGTSDTLAVNAPSSLFWVYLSRFHPSVKRDVVEKLVRDGLRTTEPVKVVSLVKKATDPLSMNFISYKVGIPMKLKENALNPETWPQGIVYREFEDTQVKNNVWLPPDIPALPAVPETIPGGSPTGTPFGTPAPLDMPVPLGTPSITVTP
ncbi:uncharacterized protein LOC135710956 [Ochlerotatus camptorhynchus]|uniref:uncharacterized protein LOC135710956 n=1 Tax=Ochlerotatus camptorhynchus TaxID=644619 RepID=UPI0031D9185B